MNMIVFPPVILEIIQKNTFVNPSIFNLLKNIKSVFHNLNEELTHVFHNVIA